MTFMLRAIGVVFVVGGAMELRVLAVPGVPLWGFFVVAPLGLAFVLAGISVLRL